MNTENLSYTLHDSPIGSILLVGTTKGLHHITFDGRKRIKNIPQDSAWIQSAKPFGKARKQLDEYFTGKRKSFSLSLTPQGTEFQHKVWQHLSDIAYGQTSTYGAIAAKLGNRNASRAVGAANGANPLSIVVPCHRVIGANGKLTGFAGGLAIKDWLLALERGEQSLFSFEELSRNLETKTATSAAKNSA